ncbi:uncharacterized protein LOC122046077 isoform X2 [Zingiber officinale]|uniref:uncharacterized protein LOC122046077 isoform X2 n=1 Tax=Zingiber officinale TaxID=94328 RepID=UPI001C4C0EFC|nr:uncharacterized protein LOC122046077 isoform X2 [Zingiber officinale]
MMPLPYSPCLQKWKRLLLLLQYRAPTLNPGLGDPLSLLRAMSASSHPLALTAKRGAPEPPAAVAVPMEDTVQALIDYLVQPLLPARAFPQASPSQEKQESVARQMHSVVLLYNYYHRKQFPHLVFLDFRSFCKQATISKPSLLSFMKFMHKNVEYSLDLDKELSIMEKEIMSACNIATTLDALKNSTSMNGWPVSKVAVLLVDVDQEKCYLECSSITQRIWSLPEQKLDEPIASVIKSFSYSYPNKSLKSSLQQLAISAVQQKTGNCSSKFCVLEDHRVYSFNDEKTATMLYIMKSLDTVNGALIGFSIKEVLSSLRGPLVKAGLTPEVTKVVEYYHLLPYVDILSDWLSRVAPHSPYLNSPPRHPIDVHNLSEVGGQSTMVDHGLNKSYMLPTLRDEAVEDNSTINVNTNEIGKPDVNSATISKSLNEPSFAVSNCCKIKNNTSSDQLQQSSLRKEAAGSRKSVIASPCLNKCGSDIYCSSDGGNGCTDKVDRTDIIKRRRPEEVNAGEIVGRKDTSRPCQDAIDSYHLPLELVGENLTSENIDELDLAVPSKKHEVVLASLRILQKRRDDLVRRHRHLGDELAQDEMKIQAILSGKLDVESGIQTCNALSSSQTHTCTSRSLPSEIQSQQEIRVRRFSEAILRSNSPCQELDNICVQNGWIIPRYCVFPSIANANECFQASVSVRGIDFEASVVGNFRSTPCEARLSAATNMINKLHAMSDQQALA